MYKDILNHLPYKSSFRFVDTITELDEDGISSLVSLTQQVFIELVHQVSDWGSGAAAYFGWMREAKRENTRCGL